MLNLLRSSTRSWFVRGFFLLLALSFGLFWGIQDIAKELLGDKPLAQVGPYRISTEEYQLYLHWETQQAVLVSGHPPSKEQLKDPLFLKDVLIQMVRNKLIELEAERIGFVIPDEHIRDMVHQSPLFQKHRSFDHPKFLRWLHAQGLTEKQFIHQFRFDLLRSYFLYAVVTPMFYVPQSYTNLYGRVVLEQRQAQCAVIPYASQKVNPPTHDTVLKEFLKTHPEHFIIPETRSGVIVTLDRRTFESDDDFDAQLVRVEQSLDQEESLKNIQALHSKIRVFAFSETDARGYTYDASGHRALSVSFPEKTIQTIFETDTNQTSDPVSLDKNLVILVRINHIRPEQALTFDQARPQILSLWMDSEQKNKTHTLMQEIQKNPKTFHSVITRMGWPLHSVTFHRPESAEFNFKTKTQGVEDSESEERAQKIFGTPLQNVALRFGEKSCEACYVAGVMSPSAWPQDVQSKLERWIQDQYIDDLMETYMSHLAHTYKVKFYPQADALVHIVR